MQFTLDQVLQLAPDDASAKAAKGLAVTAKWLLLGTSEAALWGECQGSGSKPYQVQMDLGGPAFRCTCPSRKFPCKHGLALMLLRVQKIDAFAAAEPPAWVAEWLASRQQRAAKQEEKKAQDGAQSAADPNAAAKREAKRLERMAAGAEELQRWLADQVRHGLGNLAGTGADWQALAARMVDAQAPGLAFRVKKLGEIAASGGDWPVRLLAAMGRLHVLLDAFRRLAELPPPVQVDVRAAMGWPLDKDDVLSHGERIADRWDVLGQCVEENGRLWERRVWLQGRESGRRALLLDFAHGNPVYEQPFLPETALRMTLAFYPGAHPWRALIVDRPEVDGAARFSAGGLAREWAELAAGIAANPWQSPLPLAVAEAVPHRDGAGWALRTADGGRLPLAAAGDLGWQLVALGGGRPLTVFGEWDGERLSPLSAWTGEGILAERQEG
jgi:hypothetical protein